TEFTVIFDSCTTHTLAPMATCTVKAQFNPTSVGSKSATINVSAAPGGTAPISLTGKGRAKLTVSNTLYGAATGSVASSPGAINCVDANTGTCSGYFDLGSQPTLTATTTALFHWTAGCTGSSNLCTPTMNG